MAKEEATLLLRVKNLGKRALKGFKKNLDTIKRGAAIMGTAVAGAIGLSVKAFADFEQGLIGVGKTADLSGRELEKVGEGIREMATRIPQSTSALLEIATAAGQLGVKGRDNILKFTEVMAKLASASDVAGEDGAKAISRILTVTGDGIGKIDRFAAALVDLGNNAAASESEILEVANRVAGQIARFDVGSTKVLGFATALKSLGKRSEAAGSVLGRAFDAIDQSIRSGGASFTRLQEITGMTGEQLRKTFKEDASVVFQSFINGMSRIEASGGNVTRELSRFDLQGVRINDVLGTLIKRNDVMNESLKRSVGAWEDNTALNEEAERAFKAVNAQIQLLVNRLSNFGILIGKAVLPGIKFLSDALTDFGDNTKAASPVIEGLAFIFRKVIQAGIVLKNILDFVGESIGSSLGASVELVKNLLTGDLTGALDVVKRGFLEVKDSATKNFDEMWEGVADVERRFEKQSKERHQRALERRKQQEKQNAKEITEAIRTEKGKQMAAEVEAERRKQEKLAEVEEQKANERHERDLERRQEQKEAEREQENTFKEEDAARERSKQEQELQDRLNFLNRKIALEKNFSKRMKLLDKRDKLFREAQEKGFTKFKLTELETRQQAQQDTFSKIATLAQSNNTALATIGKAAALTQIAIEGPVAVTKALSAFPPPANFAAAAAVGAAVAAQAAKVAGVALADGGIVSARPGGLQATIGEGGRDEAVVPLEDGNLGGNVTINIGTFVGSEENSEELARIVDRGLLKLRQGNESLAFDEAVV